jgi:putative DNA-invertase from lambdoid prophage Rac
MASNPRVGIYLRCSTDHQSTDLQSLELRAYAASRGWTDLSVYEDRATGTNANRAELKRLLADAKARKVDIVLVWKLDRFARSLKDLLTLLQELAEVGVDFISLRDQLDLTTAAGRLMAQLIGAFAEFEASLIKERVKAGLRAAKAKGKRLGRPRTIDRYQVERLRAQGLSLSQIALELGTTKSGVSKTLRKPPSQVAVISAAKEVV